MTKLDDLYKPHVGVVAFDVSEGEPSDGVHVRWFAVDSIEGKFVIESAIEPDGTIRRIKHKYKDVVTCHQMFVVVKGLALTAPYEDVMTARMLLASYAYFVGLENEEEIADVEYWMKLYEKPVRQSAWKMLSIGDKKRIAEHIKAKATASVK